MHHKNLNLKFVILGRYPTQADFAQVVGLHETRLSRIICGRVTPTPDERARIIRTLGISDDDLFPPAPPVPGVAEGTA